MVVWEVTASEIGPDDCGAIYCETKEEAMQIIRRWREDHPDERIISGPEKIIIRNRADLCRALNDAMGYGAS